MCNQKMRWLTRLGFGRQHLTLGRPRGWAVAETVLAGAVFLLGAGSTGAAVIDFDDAPDGTIVDTRYPGVTFGCLVCSSGHAFARDMNAFGSTTAASGANVVTLVAPGASTVTSFDTRQGALSAVFAVPQRFVSIDARPQLPLEFLGTANNKPYLELYNSTAQNAATLIARVLYPLNYGDPGYCTPSTSACGGPWQTIAYTSSSDNIVSIRISCQNSQSGPAVYGDFDNLRFETGASMARASAVSEFAADFSAPAAGMQLFGGARLDAGYLKLITAGVDSFGIAYVDDFNKGQAVHGFHATFDAALFGSTCCAGGFFPADGFSFNLVPASTVRPNPAYNEPGEEGLAEGLAVCFDTWDNGGGEAPAVDVKWLGQTIATVPFMASQSPNGITDPAAAKRAVVIHLDTDGTLDVSYGGTELFRDLPTPFDPARIGVPKWVLGARVGLATDHHWIDNLRITALAGPQRCLDFNAAPAANVPLFGGARVDGGFLKLLTAASDSFGIAYVPDFGGGRLVQGFRASFKASLFGSTCCGNGQFPADGFSFNLAPAATVRSNPAYGEPAEEGLDEGLAVNFDTWDNGGGEGPAIEVKWLGQVVARTPFQPSQSPIGAPDAAAAARNVIIDLRTDGTMDVFYGGTKVLDNVQTPYDPAWIGEPVWVLGARVGGANDNHWIDDLCITAVPARGRPIPGLFNTGVGADRRPLAEDQVDPHYGWLPNGPSIVPIFPAYAATAAGGFPIPPWLPDNLSSAWIAPTIDTVSRGDASFVAQTWIDLTGFNPGTARIRGRWAADNRGTEIRLNGVPVPTTPAPSFDLWTEFTISTGFVAGSNSLQFVIFNEPALDQPLLQNPAGLRVELAGSGEIDCNFAHSRPTVGVRRSGSGVELRWHGPGWVLQGSSAVSGPWSDLGRGSSANGSDFTANVAASGAARFFRLRLECR